MPVAGAGAGRVTHSKAPRPRPHLLGLGSINGANHNFPLLLPLSIQNIWASIQNVWCAPPIEYFILLLSHNDTDKYLLYYGDSRVITSSFLQHRRRSRSSRLSSKMFSPTDAKIRLVSLKTRSMEALDVCTSTTSRTASLK